MKILLFGKSGLLGHALFSVLKNEYTVLAPTHEECDITSQADIKNLFEHDRPDYVINASGFTKVDDAENNPEQTFLINEDGPKNLSRTVHALHIPLIHFSTDYVFDGTQSRGYVESDSPAPLSIYGKSKAKGEEYVKKMEKFYLIRTSWLFGQGGHNFVDTILTLAENGKPIRIVNDQIGCPTYTIDLAQAVLRLLKGFPYGIYHIVNSGACSWAAFAEEIFKQLGVPQKIIPISSQELKRKAMRPACSILQNMKFPLLRPWQEALTSFLHDKTILLA